MFNVNGYLGTVTFDFVFEIIRISPLMTDCGRTLELFCNWRYAGQSKMEEFVRKLVKTSDLRYATFICFNEIKGKNQ